MIRKDIALIIVGFAIIFQKLYQGWILLIKQFNKIYLVKHHIMYLPYLVHRPVNLGWFIRNNYRSLCLITTLIATIAHRHCFTVFYAAILLMLTIVIITFFSLLLCWFLLAPFEFSVDTRLPQALLRWAGIGKIMIIYDNGIWWVKLQVLFFKKEWMLQQLFSVEKKISQPVKPVKKKKAKQIPWHKFFKILKTFRVVQWQIAADTGNYPVNARLFPLNFYPPFRDHININFNNINYFVFSCRNAPWRILYAWIK